MFFKEKISTILTNIICFGDNEVVEKYGSEWGLKEISRTADAYASEFSFPTSKNLFFFLDFCQKEKIGRSYGVVMTIVLENGKLWHEEFTLYNDSDLEDQEEYDELVAVLGDMKEYYARL